VADSLFDYPNSTTCPNFTACRHPEFIPTFGIPSNVTSLVLSRAVNLCTVNGMVRDYCLQDYILTNGNEIIANSSRVADVDFNILSTLLGEQFFM